MYWNRAESHPQLVLALQSFIATQNLTLVKLNIWMPVIAETEGAGGGNILEEARRNLIRAEPTLE